MPMLLDIKNSGDKMALDHDVDVPMRDGSLLRANVFRPQGEVMITSTFRRVSSLANPASRDASLPP